MSPLLADVSLALLAWSMTFAPPPVATGAAGAAGTGPDLPPGWYTGDTHVHIQPCGAGPDLDVNAIVQDMQNVGLNVACGLYWNATKDFAGEQKYFDVYSPLIDGNLHAASLPGADTLLQMGVEVSGFSGAQFGHINGIGIDDGHFPDVEAPGPILDFFRAQAGAITGFAHVRWPHDYVQLSDGQLFHLVSAMLPVELALGTVDFVEAPLWDPNDLLDWRGAYYKLLNTGLRVAITAGTDNPCIYPTVGPMQTFARIDGPVLEFDAWTAAVKAGRTSIAVDGAIFLDLDVGGQGIGGELSLPGAATIAPLVSLSAPVGAPLQGTLRLIQDGISVAETPVDLPSGGPFTFSPSVTVSTSGWLAASFEHLAHTGAVYVLVDGQPIASTADALYFQDIAERLITPPPLFKPGFSAAVIAARSAKAAEIFAALASIESPPTGVVRYGHSTPGCEGPITIGATTAPVAGGATLGITCLNAPPSAFGLLLIGDDQDQLADEILGVQLYIDPLTPFSTSFAGSDSVGYARENFALAPELLGLTFHAQFGWLNTAVCAGAGLFCASDALQIVVQ